MYEKILGGPSVLFFDDVTIISGTPDEVEKNLRAPYVLFVNFERISGVPGVLFSDEVNGISGVPSMMLKESWRFLVCYYSMRL